MRRPTQNSLKLMSAALGLGFCLLANHAGAQTQMWWDNNAASPATSGTWDQGVSSFWSTTSALSASPTTFSSGNFAIFAAGSTTISALTITVPGAVTCEGLGDGTTDVGGASGAAVTALTFSGAGSINLPAGQWSIECGGSGNSITINVPITGTGGIIQHNNGSLYLYGVNTYSGGTGVTGGQILYYNNNASFGTGPITNTGSSSILNTLGSMVTLPNAIALNTSGVLNFGQGSTTCTGPVYLLATTQLKNNGGSGTTLTMS